MKNSKNVALRALLVLAVAGLPIMVSAGGGLNIKASNDEKTAIISLAEIQSDQAVLTIEDASESLVYYSTYVRNTSDFIKRFDYSSLKNGDYFVVVKIGSNTIKQSISVIDSKLVVNEPKISEKPMFTINGEKLYISVKNELVGETRVAISGKNGVFFEDITSDKFLLKKYNISNLPSGAYEVFISNENNSFTYEFALEY